MQISFQTYKPARKQMFNKLSLDKDEQARICFLEQNPAMVYVHTLEKVVLGSDGEPIIIHDTWQDGSPHDHPKTEYAGKFRCLGDEDVLQTSGVDADNCPACRAHIENSNAVKAPQPRFIGHVLKYKTKPGSFAVAKPFAGDLLVWDLTPKRFAALQVLWEEHGELSKKDLLLGPCENKQMQKFDIAIGSGNAEWTKTDAAQAFVAELYQDQKVEDLSEVAGKKPTLTELSIKISEIVRAYNHAFGVKGADFYESALSNDSDSIAAAVDKPAEKSAPKKAATPAAVEEEEDDDEETPEADTFEESEDDSEDEGEALSIEDLLKNFPSM